MTMALKPISTSKATATMMRTEPRCEDMWGCISICEPLNDIHPAYIKESSPAPQKCTQMPPFFPSDMSKLRNCPKNPALLDVPRAARLRLIGPRDAIVLSHKKLR